MIPTALKGHEFDGPAEYRIRISGRLDERWRSRLGGMLATDQEHGWRTPQTELRGLLPDQAALMGVLELLYSRGVTIIRVERLRSCDAGTDPPDSGGSRADDESGDPE